MRIVELADEFGRTTAELLDVCDRLQIPVAHGGSEISAVDVARVREAMANPVPEPEPVAPPAFGLPPELTDPDLGIGSAAAPPGAPPGAGVGATRRRREGSAREAWARTSKPFDPLAIGALVCAFLPLFAWYVGWVGLLFIVPTLVLAGMVYNNAHRRHGQVRGVNLATVSIVLSLSCWVFSFVFTIVYNSGSVATKSPQAVVNDALHRGPQGPTVRILPGDCVTAVRSNAGLYAYEGLEVVPCTQAHDAEVLRVYDLATLQASSGVSLPTTGARPDPTQIAAALRRACVADYEDLVGPTSGAATLVLVSLEPTDEGWQGGDHDVACGVGLPSGQKMTGSVIPVS